MFAPSIASVQEKSAARRTGNPAYQRAVASRHAADPANAPVRRTQPGVAWDFSRVPTHPPGSRIQTKLAIGPVDDPLEHEADRVADQVMRMPAPAGRAISLTDAPPATVQRACAQCEEEQPRADATDDPTQDQGGEMAVDANQPVAGQEHQDQAEPASPGTLAGTQGAASQGRPLESGARSFFEQRFGRNFDHVRIHTDEHAAASTRAVNALAYTVGNSIVFGPGQYEPGTAAGQRLLAHELAHVVQQASGAAGSLGQTMATSVLQRWSANGPADKSTNTIVCDGADGIRVQIGTGNDKSSLPCLVDCITQHEGSHRSDALGVNTTVCKGKADGSQVNFSTGEQKPSEIKASQVEIDCLNGKLKSAGDDCKSIIQDRIRTMITYRDSFK